MAAVNSSKKRQQRARRKFDSVFKANVVRLLKDGNESVAELSKRLDLTENSVRNWAKQAEVDAVGGTSSALTTAEREELQRLRRENKRLEMEREILKKAAAFFAKENS